MTKTCTKCGETKDETKFHRNGSRGRRPDCSACNNKAKRTRETTTVRGRLHTVYRSMRQRCGDPNVASYPRYGGRGITVEFLSFDHFVTWSLANGYERGLQIDRIDNNGNYSPDNCRWVTPKVNSNNKSDTHHLTAFGETKTLRYWSEDPRCVVTYDRLRQRFYNKWDMERAITTTVRGK